MRMKTFGIGLAFVATAALGFAARRRRQGRKASCGRPPRRSGSLVFIMTKVPETKGKTLEEISKLWR